MHLLRGNTAVPLALSSSISSGRIPPHNWILFTTLPQTLQSQTFTVHNNLNNLSECSECCNYFMKDFLQNGFLYTNVEQWKLTPSPSSSFFFLLFYYLYLSTDSDTTYPCLRQLSCSCHSLCISIYAQPRFPYSYTTLLWVFLTLEHTARQEQMNKLLRKAFMKWVQKAFHPFLMRHHEHMHFTNVSVHHILKTLQ